MKSNVIKARPLATVLLAALLLTVTDNWACASSKAKPLPEFAKVKSLVLRHFASIPDYEPGDIIARSQAEPIFGQLHRLGWDVADRKSLVNRVPPDNDFLFQQLHTPAGRKFMAQTKQFPNAYDRLDRLARLPHGRQTLHDLIRGPDGYKMIEYMTSTRGGLNLGKMLSKAPKGKGFNKPTRRIYTAKMLLEALKRSHDAAKKAASEDKKGRTVAVAK